ncbi:MAG TPA: NAD(P)H-dependent glycerol-3-phosphate dehydrogenase [Gemmatimonadaceae bacterium]|nr:MAG: glycerol-3-phosphate dehydrogenase [Gemmatimonadetes bacterium SCN 70-22]HMN08902.1 NAD(P)H-dependent glycerol-3-phosphate dehydrogenase [Gemmatimonadaceae bacterium]
MRCTVVGGGAWGSALAHLLARGGHAARLWAREADVVEHVNLTHANPRFLPGATLDPAIRATTSLSEALGDAELVVYVAPSHVLRDVVRGGREVVAPGALAVVATKGIERGSLALMTDVVREELPGHPVVALSGPSFALEVARGMPTAVVAASGDGEAAEVVQRALSSSSFRVYTNDDVTGVEVGGALKNVMAVATGIAEGVGLGLNSRAALITRGLAEMTRLGVALGARPETFAGLAGMGDLVLTCTGALSRNRAVGVEVGKGRPLEEVLAATESVAEGVTTTESARALAVRMGVDMPIVAAVARILFEQQAPHDALADLMGRELRPERDG